MANVRKTLEQRLEELRQAVVVIRHGLEMSLREGEFAHVLPVTGLLRSLLVKSPTNHPLLLEIAEELDFPLEFYSIPLDFLERRESILAPMSVQWTGDSIRATAEGPPFHVKVTFQDWLGSTQAIVYGTRITGEQLIKMAANKSGGSHLDPTMPAELAEMKLFKSGKVSSDYFTLVRLGDVVAYLGDQLLAHAGQGSPLTPPRS